MPTTAELLAALPGEDEHDVADSTADLDQLFASLADRPVPTGSVRRLCSLGGLSAKLGLAYVAWWIRTIYQPAGRRERDLLETNLRAAFKTLETMGYLRGAVSKLGQLLTSFPESIPAEFITALSNLHFHAPPMHYSLIREQLLAELGDPDEVFAEFDREAIAAASIGQVHRARLKSGEEVAVKIQYPGIARTIRADLRNLKTMMRPFLFNENWRAVEALFEELRVGLEAETDYCREAENCRDVASLFRETPEVVVPHIYDSFSTTRVLTMDFLPGMNVDEYVASNPTQDSRDRFGTLISQAIHRVYRSRLLYNDANPGNFLFMEDGKLGFIDFGNLRRFSPEEWAFHETIFELKSSNDVERIRRVCAESAMMTPAEMDRHADVVDLIVEWLNHYNEPWSYEGAFDYGDPEYLRRGAELMRRAMKLNWVRQKPQNIFAHRLNFQLPALLFKLRSRINVPELIRAEEIREKLN